MPIELQRTGFDLAPKDTGWWWRCRRPVLSASMSVEMSQARVQQVDTAPFPVRFLHDPWLSIVTAGDDQATNGVGETFDPFVLDVSVEAYTGARISEEGGIDFPPEPDAVGWNPSGSALLAPTIGPDTYMQISGPLLDRSLWDSEGSFDFVRLRVNVQTVSTFTGRVDVTAELWANQQCANLAPGIPKGEPSHSYFPATSLYRGAL